MGIPYSLVVTLNGSRRRETARRRVLIYGQADRHHRRDVGNRDAADFSVHANDAWMDVFGWDRPWTPLRVYREAWMSLRGLYCPEDYPTKGNASDNDPGNARDRRSRCGSRRCSDECDWRYERMADNRVFRARCRSARRYTPAGCNSV